MQGEGSTLGTTYSDCVEVFLELGPLGLALKGKQKWDRWACSHRDEEGDGPPGCSPSKTRGLTQNQAEPLGPGPGLHTGHTHQMPDLCHPDVPAGSLSFWRSPNLSMLYSTKLKLSPLFTVI